MRITMSWYPIFNGSHFGLPPSSIHRMTGLGGKKLWTMCAHRAPLLTNCLIHANNVIGCDWWASEMSCAFKDYFFIHCLLSSSMIVSFREMFLASAYRLVLVQVSSLTVDECKEYIEKFEPSPLGKKSRHLTIDGEWYHWQWCHGWSQMTSLSGGCRTNIFAKKKVSHLMIVLFWGLSSVVCLSWKIQCIHKRRDRLDINQVGSAWLRPRARNRRSIASSFYTS